MIKNKYIIFIIIICIQITFSLIYGLNKPNLFIDEFWSLNLANGNIPLLGNASEYYNKIISKEFWLSVITPTNGNINLENVWNNQAQDVHPPFYYMLLHLFFCLTPPHLFNFGKIYLINGILLNIVFFVFSQICLYKISQKIFKNSKISFIVILFYGFSLASFSTVLMIRMYMMLTFWVLLSVLLHLILIEHDNSLKSYKFWLILCLTNISGFLTNYYYIISIIPLGIIILLWLYILKDTLNIKYYILSGVISFLISIIIFPSLLKHIFYNGYRGKEAFKNLFESNFVERLQGYYSNPDGFNYSTGSSFFIFILLILLVICIFKNYLEIKINLINNKSIRLNVNKRKHPIIEKKHLSPIIIDNTFLYWITMAWVFFIPILLITKISPFLDMRYIAPQFPIFTIIMTGFFYYIFNFLKLNKKIIISIILFLFFALANVSWHPSKVHWYFSSHKLSTQLFVHYPNTICVNLSDNKSWWPVISQGYNFTRCQFTIIFESNSINYNLLKSLNPKSIILYESFINKNKNRSNAIAKSLNLPNIKYLYDDHGKVFHLY